MEEAVGLPEEQTQGLEGKLWCTFFFRHVLLLCCFCYSRFTPSGGSGRSRRVREVGLSTGRSSLSSSRAGSEASMSSASDLSDGESDTSKVNYSN